MSSAFALSLMGTPAAANEARLAGFFVGAVLGHAQTTETVRVPQGQDVTQYNDISGNDIVPGIRVGWAYSQPGGVFFGVDAYGLFPFAPHPTTILQANGQEYVVEAGIRGGVVARFGYTVKEGNAAIYVLAGASVGQNTTNFQGRTQQEWLWQPEIGAGMEIAVWRPNTSIRLDVQMAHYERDDPYRKGVQWTGLFTFAYRF